MQVSIIIAAHNEGELLSNTIGECIPLCNQYDCEIIVANDCSTDNCIESVTKKFPEVRIVQTNSRMGPSPTKDLGAQAARGEVFIFLDGHCKPEPNSIEKLISNTVQADGESIFVPRIAALDESRWENELRSTGDGYGFNMQTMDTFWVSRERMEMVGAYFESPALIGCCFAVSRALYWKLWGFDPHMYEWGIEDIEFGLKAWLLGHSILIDPTITIGHRFRQEFSTYTVSSEHVLANKMRMARKCYSHTTYTDWIDFTKAQIPSSLWSAAQDIYNQHQDSVERERAYIQSQQVRSDCGYASRFEMDWPEETLNEAKSSFNQLNKSNPKSVIFHPVFDGSATHAMNSSHNTVITYDAPEAGNFQIQLRISRDSNGLLIIQDADVHGGGGYDVYHAAYRVVSQLRGHPVHSVRQFGQVDQTMEQRKTGVKNLTTKGHHDPENIIWERIHQVLSEI